MDGIDNSEGNRAADQSAGRSGATTDPSQSATALNSPSSISPNSAAQSPVIAARKHASPLAGAWPSRHRTLIILTLTLAASAIVYWLLPRELGELGRRAVAIGLFAAALWATEALPLFVTSLSVVGLEVLLLASDGGLATTGELSYTQFFEPFASSTIILFLGGFLLAAAVTKHGLDRAVASRLLRPFMSDSYLLIMAVIFTTGFLSIVMSNTAAAVMMLAIIAPLTRDERSPRSLVVALVLAVAFGASIGGISTPVSTPPNAITISQLRAIGVHISFVEWMLMAVPLAAGMLVITGALLVISLRPPRKVSLAPIERPARLSWRAWATAAVLLASIAAWLTGPWHHVADAAVALIAATILAALGALDRRDVRSIDWDVLLLMWGGLALGNALHLTGVLEYIGGLDLFRNQPGALLALTFIVSGMIFSTFMSNTAAANILVPLAIALSIGAAGEVIGGGGGIGGEGGGGIGGGGGADGLNEAVRLAVLAGLTVTFAIALPISTPPNAIAYATGKVTNREMIAVGTLVSLIAIAILMVGYFWVLPWVLRV